VRHAVRHSGEGLISRSAIRNPRIKKRSARAPESAAKFAPAGRSWGVAFIGKIARFPHNTVNLRYRMAKSGR